MTRALSQPWQVRWPETKYSVYGTCLTVLIELRSTSSVGEVTVSVMCGLLPNADPVNVGLQLAGAGLLQQVEHLLAVGRGELPATQAADDVDHRGSLRAVIERGAELGEEHATVMRRTEAVVAVDDAHGLEAAQPRHDIVGRERTEPLQAGEADLVALLAQPAHDDSSRHGDGALSDEHVV